MPDQITPCPICCSKLKEVHQTITPEGAMKYLGKLYEYTAECAYCGWEYEWSTTDYEIKRMRESAEAFIALAKCKNKKIEFMRYKPLEVACQTK